jgi:ribonuclease HI
MENWVAGWKRNNWRKRDGQPVVNEEEIRRLDFLCSKIKIIWVTDFKRENLYSFKK